MRLYLSSFRMGDHPEYLTALAGESGHSAVVIANALDDAPAAVRRSGVEDELVLPLRLVEFRHARVGFGEQITEFQIGGILFQLELALARHPAIERAQGRQRARAVELSSRFVVGRRAG